MSEVTDLRAVVYELAKAVSEHINDPLGHIYSGTLAPGDRAEGLVKVVEHQRFLHDGIEAPE